MPTYPEDLATRLRRLELLVERLFTASQLKEPFTKLVARGMVVGQDAPGRRWVFNPDGTPAGSAEIWGVPAGAEEENAVRIIADTDAGYPGQVLFHIISGEDNDGDAEFRLASGEVFMRVRDTGGADDGGYAYWGRSRARFGYKDGSNDNYFDFSRSSISQHTGQWNDFTGQFSDAGLLWGSLTVSGSSTNVEIFYPGGMLSNMGPIFGLRTGSGTANTRWSITASSSSSVVVRWDTAQSVALYMCSFRH